REVLAVPGSPLDPRARGANDLIRQGAAVCEGALDVLRVLEAMGGVRERDREPWAGPLPDFDADHAALMERVAAMLSPTPTFCDDIIRALGAPPPAVFAALVELSLAGEAEFGPGGTVSSTSAA